METNKNQSTTLRDYLKIIFRHKILFVILPIAIIIPVFISLQLKTPIYRSSVKMYIKAAKQAEADYYSAIGSRNLPEEHTELVKSNIVIERVVEALKLYNRPIDYDMKFVTRLKAALMQRSVKQFKQQIAAMSAEQKQAFLYKRAVGKLSGSINSFPAQSYNFFIISVSDYDPAIAAVIANSVSRSYVVFDLEQQILELELKYGEKHGTVIQLQNHINTLLPTLDGRPLSDIEAIGPASIKIIGQANHGALVGGVNQTMLLALSIIAGIILAIVFCFVLEMLDYSIRLPKDIERLHIPFLGSISKKRLRERLLIGFDNPGETEYAKSVRNLSEKLYLLMRDNNVKTLLLTDADGSAETAAIVTNLGMFMANKTARKVLLIDADLKTSSLSKILNNNDDDDAADAAADAAAAAAGLVDILKGKMSIMDAIHNMGSGLYVLPSGDTGLNASTLLKSSGMSEVIKVAKEEYDYILINSPNLKNCTDSIVLSSITDGTAIVINEGKVRRQIFEHLIEPLRLKQVNIIGAILNNRKYVIPNIIYRNT